MDIFFIALLLAAALGGAVLLARRRPPSVGEFSRLPTRPVARPAARPAWQQEQLPLDPPTRFVETPQRKIYRLLDEAEQELFQRLQEAMPNMRVFAQVGVAQLALIRGRHEARRLHRLAGRGIDFVVCNPDFAIVAAIELNWPGADEAARAAAEEKREALHSLGIPLIQFRPNALPDAEAISREIADAIVRRNRLEGDRR
jgi:hypothetical protein